MEATSEDMLAQTARNLMAAKMYSLASCVMLFYDIAITLEQEVEVIWMQPRYTYMTLLWVLNRYLSPLGYIVIIVSFHTEWSDAVCDRYILYPEALKIVTAFVIGVLFVIRIYAIYGRSKAIAVFGAVVLAAELSVKIWAFTDGVRLVLPEGIVGCILVGKTHTRFVFTWIAELIFDTIIFLMTLWSTVVQYRFERAQSKSLLSLIMRDGVVYFAVIFAANVVTVCIFLVAPPDIKAINASFSTLITSLMVSRLILNLKTAVTGGIHHAAACNYNHCSHAELIDPDRGANGGLVFSMTRTRVKVVDNDTAHISSTNVFVTRQEISKIVAKSPDRRPGSSQGQGQRKVKLSLGS